MPDPETGVGAVVDPTKNVLDLVEAGRKRSDDLQAAETRRQDDLRAAETRRQDELRAADSRRLNDLAEQKKEFDDHIVKLLQAQITDSTRELRTIRTSNIQLEGKGLGRAEVIGYMFAAGTLGAAIAAAIATIMAKVGG